MADNMLFVLTEVARLQAELASLRNRVTDLDDDSFADREEIQWGSGFDIVGEPELYQVVAARYVKPDGTVRPVDSTPGTDDKLLPTWDWVRLR
jgi:hypothetical protein